MTPLPHTSSKPLQLHLSLFILLLTPGILPPLFPPVHINVRPSRQSPAVLTPENPCGPQALAIPLPDHTKLPAVHHLSFCLVSSGVCILLPEPECEPSLSDTPYVSSQILSTLPLLPFTTISPRLSPQIWALHGLHPTATQLPHWLLEPLYLSTKVGA